MLLWMVQRQHSLYIISTMMTVHKTTKLMHVNVMEDRTTTMTTLMMMKTEIHYYYSLFESLEYEDDAWCKEYDSSFGVCFAATATFWRSLLLLPLSVPKVPFQKFFELHSNGHQLFESWRITNIVESWLSHASCLQHGCIRRPIPQDRESSARLTPHRPFRCHFADHQSNRNAAHKNIQTQTSTNIRLHYNRMSSV